MKKTLGVAVVASMALFSGSLMADGAALFQSKTCWSCHGKDAKTPIMPVYPKIAGQNKDYTLQQLKDIKSGARSNGQAAAMKGVMGLVSDEEMVQLAEYLSSLPQ